MPSQLNLRERFRLRPTLYDGTSTSDLSTALLVQTLAAPLIIIAASSTITATAKVASSPTITAIAVAILLTIIVTLLTITTTTTIAQLIKTTVALF